MDTESFVRGDAVGQLKSSLGSSAVHLCIDMQRLFAPGGPWPAPWIERVTPVVVQLARKAPERTIFTRFIPPVTPEEMPGTWQAYYRKWRDVTRDRLDPALLDLLPDLRPYAPPATVMDKASYSAFADGRLHTHLRQRNVDTLIMSGSETDVCVLGSALAAVDLGYRVVIANDAVCSSSDEAHDAMIALYEKRFDVQIELAGTAEILRAWRD